MKFGRISFKLGPFRISFPLKVLIPGAIIGVAAYLIFSCFSVQAANIPVVNGDDDECDHQWVEVDYDSDTNSIYYECEYCDEVMCERVDDFLEELPGVSTLSLVDSDGGYPEEEHKYNVVAFDGNYGIAIIYCPDCGNYFEDNWIDHITKTNYPSEEKDLSNYVPWFDRNSDEVINGKDYLYLLRDFTTLYDETNSDLISVLSDKHFYFKEIFFYVYSTLILICVSTCLCIFTRRLG